MVKYAQIVVGPAGCGKSTYCHLIQEACRVSGRSCRVINLDPAAEEFLYDCEIDVRHIVTVDDVMETMDLGPNGGLVKAIEFIAENLESTLEDDLESFADDDYILFDCPGQIELYTHLDVMRNLVRRLETYDIRLCAVYCLDVSFVSDASKFVSGCLTCLSTMIQLELPHISILTKCDLLTEEEREELDKRLQESPSELIQQITDNHGLKFKMLHHAMIDLLEQFSLVGFLPLDPNDEDGMREILLRVDQTIGYGEDLDTKEPRDDIMDPAGDAGFNFGSAGF